jgi:diguanylate cyclase (GGDEF)-like protein
MHISRRNATLLSSSVLLLLAAVPLVACHPVTTRDVELLRLLLSRAPVYAGFGLLGLWCLLLTQRLSALFRISRLDPLTGLANGRCFETERWPAAVRGAQPVGVLYIDLDHLKAHNDLWGHDAGNRYILRAASVLATATRRGVDEVFRLHTAGDEFVVLVHGAPALQAATVAKNLTARFRAQDLSTSIGVAWTDTASHSTRSALLIDAQQAMRQAKAHGRGQFIEVPRRWQPAPGADAAAVPHPVDDTP